jgi:hypothetical protein
MYVTLTTINGVVGRHIHSKLHSITPVATNVHVILQIFVVLTWMRDTIESVQHVTLQNDTKEM